MKTKVVTINFGKTIKVGQVGVNGAPAAKLVLMPKTVQNGTDIEFVQVEFVVYLGILTSQGILTREISTGTSTQETESIKATSTCPFRTATTRCLITVKIITETRLEVTKKILSVQRFKIRVQ